MNPEKIKITVEIVSGFVTSLAIIVAAIWTYYRFVKGRLFSPKVEISLNHHVIDVDRNQNLVSVEVVAKNIGSVRLSPQSCQLVCKGLTPVEGKLDEKIFYHDTDISPFDDDSSSGLQYIDPSEAAHYSRSFLSPSGSPILSVSVKFIYNKRHVTVRTFQFVNQEAHSIGETAEDNTTT